MIFVYFSVISTGNIPMIFLTSTLITAGTYAMSNAIYPAWFSELFNVKVRYSGMAIGLQIGILCAGFTPLLGTALVGADKATWGPAAWIVAGSSVLAVAGALWARETSKTPFASSATRPTEAGRTTPDSKGPTAGSTRRRPLPV